MDHVVNPYASPSATEETVPSRRPLWARHLFISLLLLFLWFFVGGAIAIGGSRAEMAIDGIGGLLCLGYFFLALAMGGASGFSWKRVRQ